METKRLHKYATLELERRLEERTAQLAEANERLRREKEERRQAEEELRLQRALAENRLQDSENRYGTLFDDAVLGIFQTTHDARILNVNPAFARMFGFDSPQELMRLVENPVNDLWVDPSTRDEILRMVLKATEPVHVENRFKRRDGSLFTCNIHAWAVRDKQGKLLHIEGWLEDITERKRSEKEKKIIEKHLFLAQKMEAVGTLAGGIANDLNNILQPVVGYTEMALNELPESNPLRYDLEHVLKACRRAEELLGQILAVSRSTVEYQRTRIDFGSIVKEALQSLRSSLPDSIEIRENIETGIAMADPTQIRQVLINLCTNAVQALNGKGILEVTFSNVTMAKTDLANRSLFPLQPGPYLKLCVSDTGCGIDKEDLERIFDPYFTTREVGKGSGLGLAVVNAIVKRHDGAITVKSMPGKGSRFCVYIPGISAENKLDGHVDREPGFFNASDTPGYLPTKCAGPKRAGGVIWKR
ncbi:MAG: ATP-binding protein [Syntrophobacteraceae bacterium]|nr:ATP-binding protein [Syntrophobacteraceae bacterium]